MQVNRYPLSGGCTVTHDDSPDKSREPEVVYNARIDGKEYNETAHAH